MRTHASIFRLFVMTFVAPGLFLGTVAYATDTFTEASEMSARGYTTFGYFNGGSQKTYTVDSGVLQMDWDGTGNNLGDFFFYGDGEVLTNVGDMVQVDVVVNKESADYGDGGGGLYRSGPGLYLASDTSTVQGVGGHYSISYILGNMDNESSRPRQVMSMANLGAFATGNVRSADNTWAKGQWVTLKITYTSDTAGSGSDHEYTFEYDVDRLGSFITLGTHVSPTKMPYVGIQFHTALYDSDTGDITFPVANMMSADNFSAAPDYSAPVQHTTTETFDSDGTLADYHFTYYGDDPCFSGGVSSASFPVNGGQITPSFPTDNWVTDVWWWEPSYEPIPVQVGDYVEVDVIQLATAISSQWSQWGIVLSDTKTGAQGTGDQIWMTLRAQGAAMYPQYNAYHQGTNYDNAYSGDFGFGAGSPGDVWTLRVTVREITASGWKVTCSASKNGGPFIDVRFENDAGIGADPPFLNGFNYIGLFSQPGGAGDEDFVAFDNFTVVGGDLVPAELSEFVFE